MPASYPPPRKRRPPPFTPPPGPRPIAAKWTGVLPDKYVATLVELVSRSNVQGWVADLSAFHTRHSLSAFIGQVADWLVARFQGFGYADVQKLPFTVQGTQVHNVVCTKPGSGNTGRVIVLCGHYDCIMEDHDDAAARAPGADDNASGIAAILEVARILKEVDLEDSVIFAAFAGEEQGLLGASAYAQLLGASGVAVHRLVNLDMVGFPPPAGTVTVEEDQGNAVAANDPASRELANLMARMAASYSGLSTVRGPIYSSDYMPFEADGVVVAGLFDGEGNPHYHDASDTPNTLDYGYLADVVRITLATLLQETLAVAGEASSSVDLYVRDSPADTGSQPSPTPHWQSPDIWVRNDPPPGDNPALGHQSPINGQPNYLYVRVHNGGSAAAAANAYSVEVFRCDPGTGMIWPDHFDSLGTLLVTQPIPAGGSVRVGPVAWTPQIVDHECLLAVVSGPEDHAVPDVYGGRLNHALLVRYDNNVGQRNVSPKMSVPGGKTKVAIVVRGGTRETTNRLVVDASALPADSAIELRIVRRVTDGADEVTGFVAGPGSRLYRRLDLGGGAVGVIGGFTLGADDRVTVTLTIDFSLEAEHLERYPLVVSQQQDGAPAGRQTIEITAVKEVEDFVFGNPRSHEAHTVHCPFWPRISQEHKLPFETPRAARAHGYDGCAFCLPSYDTG